jgi:hypothetical protein
MELYDDIKIYSNWITYPQIFLNGEFIGGLDVFKELIENGEFLKKYNNYISKKILKFRIIFISSLTLLISFIIFKKINNNNNNK